MATRPEEYITRHRAFIYDRGGQRRVGPLVDISDIRWPRDRDGVTEANLTISARSFSRQRDLFEKLIPKRHELVIFRGNSRVWEGPLWRIADEGEQYRIAAKDVLQYLFGTPLTRRWDSTYAGGGVTTVTGRMEEIIEYELTTAHTARLLGGGSQSIPGWEQLDPPANILPFLQVHHFPNEAETSARTEAFQMTVGQHLQSVARVSGIDFTAVGRAIHIWDTSRSLGRTRTMTEKDFFGNIIVTQYGADHTQLAYVSSQEGVYGEAANPENLDLYGPWAQVYTAYNEEGSDAPTQAELNSQAARNLSGRSPVPFEVRVPDNSSIRLTRGLTINDLVPGVQVPLLATLNTRQWSQLQKIDHVAVTETPEGEDIQITLTPATRPDSDEEEA